MAGLVGDSYFILLSPNTQQDNMSIKTFEGMAVITLAVAPMFGQSQTSSKQFKVSLLGIFEFEGLRRKR